jgi:hypothetical protein
MKQTAVEWLENQIKNSKHYFGLMSEINSRGTVEQPNIFKKAKEMEETDLHVKYMKGWKDGYNNQQSLTDDTL